MRYRGEAMETHALRRPLRLVQISDLHFGAEPGDILDTRVNTDDTLRAVLDRIHYHERGLEGVVVTGDLAQDPVDAAYQRLLATLNRYRTPFYCLPGNHDDAGRMLGILNAGNVACPRLLLRHDWLLLMLDSSVPGSAHGELDPVELEFLDDVLSRHPAPHAMVFLHHHPLPVASPWIDAIGLRGGQRLLDILAGHDKVRGVVFGHVHQPVDRSYRGIRLLGTPATCVQFTPLRERLEIDSAPPAYRSLALHPDGGIETSLEYVALPRLSALA